MQHTKRRSESSRLSDHLIIVCISDTHELHREIQVPEGDILIHAGDFTIFSKNAAAILDFNDWLGDLPHRHKILIPGNHEFVFEEPSRRRLITNASMLVDESTEVLGLKIWGSPTTPLYGGAFGLSSEKDRMKLYSRIPADTDVLVTHGPPFGILDHERGMANQAGCRELLDAVTRIKPRLHVFGHVHGRYGMVDSPETLFVNAALLGPRGELSNRPIDVRIPAM